MKTPTPRLAVLVDLINTRFPELYARLEKVEYQPYRKPKGLRYRTWVGKRREGTGLCIYDRATMTTKHLHNPLEPYRRNSDVVEWMERYEWMERSAKGRKG